MSCNVPVVAAPFGALPRVFEQGDGLIYAYSSDGIFDGVERVRRGMKARTRERVLPYDWASIGDQLERIYQSLDAERPGP
jgi:glycosyltransferase involved in cell wall biosynthesis